MCRNYIPIKHCEFPCDMLNLVIQTRIWPVNLVFHLCGHSSSPYIFIYTTARHICEILLVAEFPEVH